MALVFPASPTVGQRYPANPGTAGTSQWQWDGGKWNSVAIFVRLNNQAAYNSYVWPNTKAPKDGFQITDNLADGVLSWEIPGGPFIYIDDISSGFNGSTVTFQLTQTDISGTVNYIPDPLTNIIIVLGGIVQTPGTSYTINSFGLITFAQAPATGAAFVGISNLNCLD
jgi:hypothetical protein